MDFLPWRRGSDSAGIEDPEAGDADSLVSCEFQDGTLTVYEDRLTIHRASASKFDDKTIAIDAVEDVTYERRLVISYIQIEQTGFETDGTGLLSTPVDENTLHFGRGMRDCARRARDTILERLAAIEPDEEEFFGSPPKS